MLQIILLLNAFLVVNSVHIQNLGGIWTLKAGSGKYDNLKATVPGGIYTDLMQNEIIEDVFYGNNDVETRWVAKSNWTYSSNFSVDKEILQHSIVNIIFEGLDTFSTIIINGVEIGKSRNMFVRYIFDVKEIITPGENTIEVQFVSPITAANFSVVQQGYRVPPECPPNIYNGECHANQIRKMQASFAWDWGPAFPSVGIWKDVYLEGFDTATIRYVLVDPIAIPNDLWLINITTFLGAKNGVQINGKILYTLQTDVSQIQQIQNVRQLGNDEIRVNFSFTIPKITVQNWWPNGYGEQKLYDLNVKFQSGYESSSKALKIGFRKIELVQDPIGSGLSFYFKVNDLPIFAKGSNEIPLDILPERGQNPETISKILHSAQAANMNMLRVWGGGVYESDYFYQKTDELGILIWQDFMFACAMYPTHPEFLSNVKEEVRHQVKRLQNHPSIAIWAGNNENELALMSNWYGTGFNASLYKEDYIKLYIETVRAEVFNITETALFVASSPSNGKKSEQDGYLSPDAGNSSFGDVHFYNYLTDSLQASTYPVPRFVSEFGYQSLPSVSTWLTVTNNTEDLNPSGDFMAHRQHHPIGLIANDLLIGYQLQLNKSIENYYETYIFYSQIIQAMSIKFETEYYRSFMGRLDKQGQGNTMGALYWQLNDVWVAPTCGKWKMLHYWARDFFAPTIITGYLDISRQLQIYAISEVPALYGTSIEVSALVEIYRWNSFDVAQTLQYNVTLIYGQSVLVASIDTDPYLVPLGCGSLSNVRTNCFFYLTLVSGNSIIAPHNHILIDSLKNSNLNKTEVKISLIKGIDDQGKKFELTLSATGISLFVWLDSHEIDGTFSENGFLQLVPEKNVTFETNESTTVDALVKVLTVVHLNHLHYE